MVITLQKYTTACTDYLKNSNKFILDVCLYFLYQNHKNPEQFIKQIMKLNFSQGILFLKRVVSVSSDIYEFALDILCVKALSNKIINQDEYKFIIFQWISVNVKLMSYTALIKKITTVAKTSENIYLFIKCLGQKRFKFRNRVILELYINGITMDLNNLEILKSVKVFNCLQIIEFEKYISQKYIQLSELLNSYKNYVRECLLTAFSLNPCLEIFNRLARFPLRKNHSAALFSISGEHYMSFDNYNEYESPNLVLDSAFSEEISVTVREDLTRIINLPRIKTLSWSIDWSQLKIECEKLMSGDNKLELVKQYYALANNDLKYCHLSKAKESFRNYNYLAKRAKEKSWSEQFPITTDDDASENDEWSSSETSMEFEGFTESESEENELKIIDVDDNDFENWSEIIKSLSNFDEVSDESPVSDDEHFFKSLNLPFRKGLTPEPPTPQIDDNKLRLGTKVLLSPINLDQSEKPSLFSIKSIIPTSQKIVNPSVVVKLEKILINGDNSYRVVPPKPIVTNNQISCKESFVRLTNNNLVKMKDANNQKLQILKLRELKPYKIIETESVTKIDKKKEEEISNPKKFMRLCLTRCKTVVKEDKKAPKLPKKEDLKLNKIFENSHPSIYKTEGNLSKSIVSAFGEDLEKRKREISIKEVRVCLKRFRM